MFQTYPIALQQLLKDAHEGKLQLPDFQRSFVWSDDAIQSLIASVAKGYPIWCFPVASNRGRGQVQTSSLGRS